MTMMRLKYPCLLLVMALAGCDAKRIYEKNVTIPGGIWNVNNLVEFELEIQDTLTPANMYINIRNSGAYSYSNLFLFLVFSAGYFGFLG